MNTQSPDPAHVSSAAGSARLLPFANHFSRLPWWALIAAFLGILAVLQIATDAGLRSIFNLLAQGIGVTVFVSVLAYGLAMAVGLLVAFARLSKNPIIFHLATFYLEIVRGVPMLVLLLFVAFAIIPGVIFGLNDLGRSWVGLNFVRGLDAPLGVPLDQLTSGLAAPGSFLIEALSALGQTLMSIRLRDFSNLARVIVALVIGYSAFLSEVFRAGIESIGRGQMEAARALGMTYWQAMRNVILPQAFRNILPPLGNDFIAMLKDSSLVSVLGVQDITGRATIYMTGSFRTADTYTVMTVMYLTMTLILSMIVRLIERRLGAERRQG
ncbi:Glutamine transport system permease protein GlnP [Anaerolineae bacterium]|nr:Glutamine transport system permease protein GlnP [Anaerolineae bacterium]